MIWRELPDDLVLNAVRRIELRLAIRLHPQNIAQPDERSV
jgi:hypothetical protein